MLVRPHRPQATHFASWLARRLHAAVARSGNQPQGHPATVVLADNQPDVRRMLRLLLQGDGRFEVVAEAADGCATLVATVDHEPDIVLLDLSMPRLDGRTALPFIVRAVPRSMVVVVSGLDPAVERGTVLHAGAFAYVSKGRFAGGSPARLPDHLVELHAAFQRALAGLTVLAPVPGF